MLAALLLGLFVLLLAPAGALGHAAFLDSKPEPGERLGSSPDEIRLEFTEGLNIGLSTATVVDLGSDESFAVDVASGSARELVLQPREPLPKAPYRVDWQTVSTVDGHTLAGSFSFGVQTAAAGSEHDIEESPLARDGWLRIAARALLYASLLFFAGGVLTAALLTRRRQEPASWLVPDVQSGQNETQRRRQRLWRRTVDAGWLATVAAVLVALAEGADAAGGISLRGESDFLLSNVAGLARVGTVVALVLATYLARARLRYAPALAVSLALLSIALSGHANSADPRALTVATDWIHLVAGAVWVGGIAQIAWAWLPEIPRLSAALRRAVMGDVLKRFGRLALPAFLVVVITGSLNALAQLGHVEALWQTAYGQVLAIKVGLVCLIALASYTHAIRLRPSLLALDRAAPEPRERRHWRLLGTEPWLGLGAIIAVAALVAFPLPPQQLDESDEAVAATCDPCPLPTTSDRELPVAEGAGSKLAAFWIRREGKGLSGTLRVYDYNARPVDTEVGIADAQLRPCGLGCWRFSVPNPVDRLTASVADQGRQYAIDVPSRWVQSNSARAKQLLQQAQERMRELETLKIRESLTSGFGVVVRARYRLQAPDRLAYATSTGTEETAIGNTVYEANGARKATKLSTGGDAFDVDEFFRWTVYGREVRWLGAGDGAIRIGLFDRAGPVWYRLEIDRKTKRIVSERMIAGAHFMTRRYFAFNRPLELEPPR